MSTPTDTQLRGLYRLSYWLTYIMIQPIYLVCIDDRTNNLYILAGENENLEFQITPNGGVF
ncbi:DUF6888 family protein [Chamaesiphon minutus]|uniref:DUF6888 domain-containing protein n=1 Tax=Chamaesiphon minutus (strain ATCC 27169 / PCC 6605) TaxID=1173020 RepID=K9UBL9_CHAP6|nr:hypothetical protein [Chamaesiphon minutus]AFY91619.1 hypothetical protein Cha6605_0319 [Chamaesiphon minutus PCC 6605]